MNNFYELIDSGEGRRLEKFGKYILDRPDPEVLWQKSLSQNEWLKADAKFQDIWIKTKNMPEKWELEYNGVRFRAKLSPFKHTGIFPEQTEQWDYIASSIGTLKSANVLNLFAYTGIATLFAAKARAKVTHVDASRPAITWANENRELNNLQDTPIRWIVDDALKFTEREIKRDVKYDAVIMDPPVYGHGPKGEPWDFKRDFPKLLVNVSRILSKDPLFVIVNAYAVSNSATTLANCLNDYFDKSGKIEHGELTLKETSADRTLSTGIWARWNR